MKVSDKDLDQLFSSKLGNMEMEPSANVWGNITRELDGKEEETTKAGLPFMKIAAGIVLLMAVGLFFIRPEHQTIALHPVQDRSATEASPARPSVTTIETPVNYTQGDVIAETATPVKHEQSKSAVKQVERIVTNTIDTAHNDQQYIAAVDQQPDNHVRMAQAATIKTQNANLVPETIMSNTVKSAAILPVKTVNPVTASLNNTKAEPAKKHKIHSLGDLLNVVIAKVDKRENKLIEFTNTDDEDSFTVTGVNLGLLRAKKEN